jgi:phosphatidylinositol-4,5-bisphosphate 4-phosphatase
MEDERQPLISGALGEATPTAPPLSMEPPPYEEPSVPAPYTGPADTTGSITGLPPPYAPPSQAVPGTGQSLFVQCRVCQHVIHVNHGSQSRVVKCTNCREATPIAPPPPGKKYVRCPCNCLLTCSETASRVICPRDNCKRTIGVGTIDVRPINTNRMRVICGKCHRSILWPSNAAVARCPHCRGRSYLYSSWMRYRAGVCFALGAAFILISVIITAVSAVLTWTSKHGGIFVLWIGMFFAGIGLIVRGVFYLSMTQSHQE